MPLLRMRIRFALPLLSWRFAFHRSARSAHPTLRADISTRGPRLRPALLEFRAPPLPNSRIPTALTDFFAPSQN